MQIVICNGGYRTGSTLAYNVLKQLAQYCAPNFIDYSLMSVTKSIVETIATHPKKKKLGVMKTHSWAPTEFEPAHVKTIYTTRNPYDVAGSLYFLADRKVEDFTVFNEVCRQKHLNLYMSRLQQNVLTIDYERYYRQEKNLIRAIANFLQLAPTEIQVDAIYDQICLEKMKKLGDSISAGSLDQATQLRTRHINKTKGAPGGWEKHLTPKQKLVVQLAMYPEMKITPHSLASS
jgi:hypothetical protein